VFVDYNLLLMIAEKVAIVASASWLHVVVVVGSLETSLAAAQLAYLPSQGDNTCPPLQEETVAAVAASYHLPCLGATVDTSSWVESSAAAAKVRRLPPLLQLQQLMVVVPPPLAQWATIDSFQMRQEELFE
jgi:hypothetical protein